MLVDTGTTKADATREALLLFSELSAPRDDIAAIKFAQDMADRMTGGKQQPWIQAAKVKGFVGGS
jgi:hypothetical protein